jgi:hypothetical protein
MKIHFKVSWQCLQLSHYCTDYQEGLSNKSCSVLATTALLQWCGCSVSVQCTQDASLQPCHTVWVGENEIDRHEDSSQLPANSLA